MYTMLFASGRKPQSKSKFTAEQYFAGEAKCECCGERATETIMDFVECPPEISDGVAYGVSSEHPSGTHFFCETCKRPSLIYRMDGTVEVDRAALDLIAACERGDFREAVS